MQAALALPLSFDAPDDEALVARLSRGLAGVYRLVRQGGMTADGAGAEERALVEAAQRGDQEALKALLDRCARPLYGAVILPRVGFPGDAEELLRDTLARAAERLHTFRWTGAGFFPWVRTIAVNLVIDRARRAARQARGEAALEREAALTQPLFHAGAEEQLIEQQERASARGALEQALATLNERQRRAVEMRVLEERPREECAAALNVTLGNFDVILHRALAALRKAYGVG